MKTFKITYTKQGQSMAGTMPTHGTGTKTVSVKIPADLYARLVSIRENAGFKSVYEILQLLIVCFTRHVDRTTGAMRPTGNEPSDLIADEIAMMFADFADTEPTPDKEARPTAHKPRKGILYE